MADGTPREYADMIVPWADVRKGDQVLEAGSLCAVLRADHAEDIGPLGSLVILVFVTYEFPDGAKWLNHHAATVLTAVRRPVRCALCGAGLARVAGGPWVRRDDPGRGEPLCPADDGDERPAHEPTLLDVPDFARLRLALAELEEARAAAEDRS